MKSTFSFAGFAVVLVACGGGPGGAPVGKIEGPPVNSLSHEQLMAMYQECTKFGQIDDPKVKYTMRYCASVQTAQLTQGYTAPGTATVDPAITKMH